MAMIAIVFLGRIRARRFGERRLRAIENAMLAIVDDEDGNPSILFQLGTFYFSIGDIKSAFASFEQAKQVASGEVLDRVTERIDGFFSSIEVTEN
ncbi:hypothetical protein N9N58_01010 [Alphaproteobacteria bacterium]|nr:hypothetical protein [Alphaproteobacteria bacterium]